MRIYTERARSVPGNSHRQVFTLGLGFALSVWYALGFKKTVQHDLASFPASYGSSPVLTIIFSAIKMCAYVLGPCLFLLMIYIPLTNLFLTRKIIGTFLSKNRTEDGANRAVMHIQLGAQDFRVYDEGRIQLRKQCLQVRNLDELYEAMDDSLIGRQLRFKIGSFNRVLSVDCVSEEP